MQVLEPHGANYLAANAELFRPGRFVKPAVLISIPCK